MMYYYDYSWFVLIPAIIFTMITQARINSAYRTYSQVPVSTGVTGAEAARAMMDANGLSGVAINVLHHRLTLKPEARIKGEDVDRILSALIVSAKVPVE